MTPDRQPELTEKTFAELERKGARPSKELLDGFIMELHKLDVDTLEAIVKYRDAIRRDGWLQQCIREYMEVWCG